MFGLRLLLIFTALSFSLILQGQTVTESPCPTEFIVIEKFNFEEIFNKLTLKEESLKDLMKKGRLRLPTEIEKLEGKNILLFSHKESPEIPIPISFDQIIIDFDHEKKSLQDCLDQGSISPEKIREFIGANWGRWLSEIENKSLEFLNSSSAKSFNAMKMGNSFGASNATTAPSGPADKPVSIDRQDSIKGNFERMILRGVLTSNNYLPQFDAGVKTEFTTNLKSLGSTLSVNRNAYALGGGLTYLDGWFGPDLQGKWNIDGAEATKNDGEPDPNSIKESKPTSVTGNIGVPFWSNWMGLTAGVGLNFNTGETIGMGFSFFASNNREVKYLGPYEGTLPELQGLHGIELNDSKGIGGYIDFGAFLPSLVLGFGSLAGYAKTKIYHAKTHMDLGLIQKYLKDRKRWDISRLFGKPLKEGLPQIENPVEMKPLDEVTFSLEREAYMMVSLGAELFPQLMSILRVGAFKSLVFKYQMKVKKLDEKRLEVTLSDIKVNNLKLFLRLIQFLNISSARLVSMAKNQTLIFDMSSPDFLKKYAEIVLGKIPSFMTMVKKDMITPSQEDLKKLYDQEAETLEQKGIKLTKLETVLFPVTKKTISASIGWLPFNRIPGLLYTKIFGSGSVCSTDGTTAIKRDIEVQGKRTAKIIKESSHDLTTEARRPYSYLTQNSQPSHYALKVTESYYASKASTSETNKILQKLNKKYDFHLNLLDKKMLIPSKELQITFEKEYNPEDFQKISAKTDEQMKDILKDSSINYQDVLNFRNELQSSSRSSDLPNSDLPNTEDRQLTIIQNFITKHRSVGLKTLDLLIQSDGVKKPWSLSIISGIFQRILQRALDLVATYIDPTQKTMDQSSSHPHVWLNARTPKKIVVKFFKKIQAAISKCERALEVLAKTLIYPSEKSILSYKRPAEQNYESMKNQLQKAKETLLYLLDFKVQKLPEVDQIYLNEILNANSVTTKGNTSFESFGQL